MSFVDLATLTLHRRNELEARTKVFLSKCDQAIDDIQKLKVQAQSFVLQLNCEPSELKERFLNSMKQLDEYTYLITDFNLSVAKLEEINTTEFAPVHDSVSKTPLPTPRNNPINLMDVLSEPMPSTSRVCSNNCPSEKPKRLKVPKEDQLLIEFSSASCSSESVPLAKTDTKTKEVQCEITSDVNDSKNKDPPPSIRDLELCNLPAQKILQTDYLYNATIMSIDGASFWVITENVDEVCGLMKDMTDFYSNTHFDLTLDEISMLNYCAFYDEDCFYRALFIKLIEDDTTMAEVFLVDTGEVRTGPIGNVQPLEPQFCTRPPYARCCHLAGIDMLSYQNKDLSTKQMLFMKEYLGIRVSIEVDDNTSESLGVYVILPSKKVLNDILIQEGLALPIDRPKSDTYREIQGPPELVKEDEDEIDITHCPEFEDPVEAVTGYSNRDEADICKHYKGGPEKTCFKGTRCNKKHMRKHPDGWTLDKIEVPVKIRSVPLPPLDSWHRALVTYICHFDRLYVQFVNKEQDEPVPNFGIVLPPSSLNALVRDMNSPAARMAYKQLTVSPAPGELVAALYPLDNQWYRARVLTVTRADQNVEVMYVDYGNVVWVKEDQIRVLDPCYLALPTQAVRCVLAGVCAKTTCSKKWAEAKTTLARMAQDRTLDAHIVGRDYDELIVELFDDDGYSIAEQLAAHDVIELKEYTINDDTKTTHKVVAA